MKALSLYIDKHSLIHDIDPISKILYCLIIIALQFILPFKMAALGILVVSLLILSLSKTIKYVFPLIGLSFIVLLSIIVIQGLFRHGNITPLFHIGPLTFYKEGLNYALLICLRVINILCAFAILVLTTKPSDLVESLVRKGLSPRIGYVLSSVFQIIPQMVATMGTILDAQRSRGMETEGKLTQRIKAFIPLMGPVVMNSLVNTRERALALEVRGFNAKAKKTFLNEEKTHALSHIIQLVLALVLIAAIIWRIFI